MQTGIARLYRGFEKTKLTWCVLCAAVYAALTVWAGGSLGGLALFWAALCVYLVLPGAAALRLLRLDAAMPRFREPLAILLGSGMLVFFYCVSVRLGAMWLVRGAPLVLSAVFAAMWAARGARRPAFCRRGWLTPNRWLLALLAATLVLLNTFASVVKYALPSRAGDVLIDQDMLWLVGNAKSFQIAFPPQEIRFYNVRLAYHYLTELLCAALSGVTGLDCYQVLAFYLQPAMLLALVVCLYRFALVFYGDEPRKTILFPFSFFLFSCASLWAILPNGVSLFGNLNLTHLLTNITSQTTATVYLCIYAGLWIDAARREFRVSWVQLAVTLCAFAMLTVAKGPVGGILLLGTTAAVLFLAVRRKVSARGFLLLGATAGVFALAYQMLFSAGANGGMALSVTDSVARTPLSSALFWFERFGAGSSRFAAPLFWVLLFVLMAPAAVIPWGISLLGDARALRTLAPERLLANACALGGLLAFFIFRHPHFSQVYFFMLGLFFVHLLAVDALPQLARAARGVRAAAALLAAVAVLTTGFLYVHDFGSGARSFLRDVGVLQKYPYDCVINADDEAAGQWLRDNTDRRTARFATNRIDTDNLHTDGISNVYTAFSGRQAMMEGYTYVADTAPWMWVRERQADNAALFDPNTDRQTILALCRRHSVNYLVYSSQMKRGAESQLRFMECVFVSPTVRIYQVPSA